MNVRVLMPNFAKVVDGRREIFGAVEAGAIQGLASERPNKVSIWLSQGADVGVK
jgi:hypothetical protein